MTSKIYFKPLATALLIAGACPAVADQTSVEVCQHEVTERYKGTLTSKAEAVETTHQQAKFMTEELPPFVTAVVACDKDNPMAGLGLLIAIGSVNDEANKLLAEPDRPLTSNDKLELLNWDRSPDSEASASLSTADTAEQEAAAMLTCLRDNVTLSNAEVLKSDYTRGGYLQADVTNNLPWAISRVKVDYIITGVGREVPYAKDDGTSSISGGIEPGETHKVTFAQVSYPDGTEVTIDANVLNVWDAQDARLIEDNINYLGTDNAITEKPCE